MSELALRSLDYLRTRFFLSAVSVLLTMSARAEAPPSQEFWNYMIEFGDTQGEVFDPTDYAAVANLPDKARAEFNRTPVNSSVEVMPTSTSRVMPASILREAPAAASNVNSAQEQSQ